LRIALRASSANRFFTVNLAGDERLRCGVMVTNDIVPGGIRTPNLLIRSQLLYPVELQTHFAGCPRSELHAKASFLEAIKRRRDQQSFRCAFETYFGRIFGAESANVADRP
jgi:hypothetical protein